jgi:hypothetical protein
MLSLKWDWSRARIWWDESPDWHYEGTEIIKRQIESTTSNQPIYQSSAIELFLPVGARFYYGALAVTFVPATAGPLVIRVPVLDWEQGADDILQDALPGRQLDTVIIGLLPEYADGVFDGILNPAIAQFLGSGTLSISGAAHGAVGSSPWMFKLLGRISVKLLNLDKKEVSDEQLIKFIRAEWTETRKMESHESHLKNILPA